MRQRLGILFAFFKSLCAVCTFLFLALLLGSLTACSHAGSAAGAPTPPAASLLEPSQPPVLSLPPEAVSSQPEAGPAAPEQSAPASQPVTAPPASEPQPPARTAPAPESAPIQSGQDDSDTHFQPVLRGNAPFFSTDLGRSVTLGDLDQVVSAEGVCAKAVKFTLADLDGDGMPEVILRLQVNEDPYFGFEILRQHGGQIYGYTMAYRALMDLKQDGTFSFSGGANDSGFGSLSFTDQGYTVHEIAYSQSGYDAGNELTVSYTVGGQAASQEEYQAAVQAQAEKESVSWHDFTDENLASTLH